MEAMRLVDSLAKGVSPDRDLARVKYLGEEEFVSFEFMKILERGADEHLREALSYALSLLGSHAAEVPLSHLLRDEDAAVRLNAAQGLRTESPARSWRPLVPLLKDPAPGVRAAAGKALGSMRAARAAPALMAAARVEGEPEVRSTLLTARRGTPVTAAPQAALVPFLSVSSEAHSPGCRAGVVPLGSAARGSPSLRSG